MTAEHTPQFKEIVALTCRVAVKFFKVDHSAVVTFAATCTEGEVLAEYPGWGAAGTAIPVQGVPAEEMLLSEKIPLHFPDVASSAHLLGKVHNILTDLDIQSILIVPIIHGGQVIGSFSLDRKKAHPFSDEEIDQCRIFAEQVSVALGVARRADHRLNQQQAYLLRRLQRTQQAARAIAQSSVTADLATILQSIATSIRGALACDAVSCYAYDPDLGEVQFPPGSDGLLRMHPRRTADELHQNSIIYGIIDELTEPYYYTEDAANDALLRSDFVLREGFVTTACLRLAVNERTVGVLFVNYRWRYRMTADDLEDLQMFGNQAAVAIENALREHKRQEGQDRVVARTVQRWLGMVNSAWGHEIHKKATTIGYEIHALRRLLADGNVAECDSHLERIARLAREISKAPMRLPLSSEEGVESVLINDLLQERLLQLHDREEYRQIHFVTSFQLSPSATVRVNADWMKQIIDSLVENAADAMRRSDRPRLTVSTAEQGRWVRISFSDTGSGIPESIQPRLFKEPIPKAKGASGSGIGLMFAELIARTYGGKLILESSDETGTTVSILLPLE